MLDGQPNLLVRLRVVARIALRFFWVYVAVLVFTLVITVSSGMDIYHRTEVPQFCNSCHEMSGNFESWKVSRHESVLCIDCHARPGLTGWLAAKAGGMRQLVTHFTAENIEDIHLGEDHLTIVSDNCQRCHPEASRLEEREGIRVPHKEHFALGVKCAVCHDGKFTHPKEAAHVGVRGLVDVGQCYRCHDGKTQVSGKTAFDASSEKECSRCHRDAALALQHGADEPGGDGGLGCLDCHERSEDEHFPIPEPHVAKLCSQCHETEATFASNHEPFKEGDCQSCHLVMSPAHLFRVGSKPTNTLCFSCHEQMKELLDAKEPTKLSAFRDGKTDLHREHKEYVGDESEAWCLACHSPHGSASPRAMVAIHTLDDKPEGGKYTAGEKKGGSCSGACHGDDEMEYSGE